MNLLLSIWPAYKTLSHIDLALAGAIMGVSCFVGDTLQIFFGPLGLRYGPKRFLFLALILGCPMALVYGGYLASGLGFGFCLLYIGVGAAYPNGALSGLLLKPKTPGKMLSTLLAVGYLGYALGPFAMRALTHLPPYTLLLPLALTALLGLCYRSPVKMQGSSKPKAPLKELRPHIIPLALLWLSQFALQGITLAILFLIPEFFLGRGVPDWISLGGGHFLVIMGTALSALLGRSLADRPHPFRLITTTATLGLTACALIVAFSLPIMSLLLALFVMGSAIGILIPLNVTLGCRLAPRHKGVVSGLLMGGAWGLGGIVPLIAGRMAAGGSPSALMEAVIFTGSFFFIPLMSGLILPFLISEEVSKSEPAPKRRLFPIMLIEWEEELEIVHELFSSEAESAVWALADDGDEVPELTDLVPKGLLSRLRIKKSHIRKKVDHITDPALRQFPKSKSS